MLQLPGYPPSRAPPAPPAVGYPPFRARLVLELPGYPPSGARLALKLPGYPPVPSTAGAQTGGVPTIWSTSRARNGALPTIRSTAGAQSGGGGTILSTAGAATMRNLVERSMSVPLRMERTRRRRAPDVISHSWRQRRLASAARIRVGLDRTADPTSGPLGPGRRVNVDSLPRPPHEKRVSPARERPLPIDPTSSLERIPTAPDPPLETPKHPSAQLLEPPVLSSGVSSPESSEPPPLRPLMAAMAVRRASNSAFTSSLSRKMNSAVARTSL